MAKYRQDRINDSVAQETSLIIGEVKDPRVSSALITVTGAAVSQDLKYAKIFYSSLTGKSAECEAGLASAAGFIRGQLARRLNLRITPELSFVYDSSLEHGMKIAKILNELDINKEDADAEGEE
ncbi:MAG: 30S ribosome-binding factor RbfA [Clostridia bacterium]|nr:30S ribosome-binding factor RbfA [Clostridia bacterium]